MCSLNNIFIESHNQQVDEISRYFYFINSDKIKIADFNFRCLPVECGYSKYFLNIISNNLFYFLTFLILSSFYSAKSLQEFLFL